MCHLGKEFALDLESKMPKKDKWDEHHQNMLEQDFKETGALRPNPYSQRTIKSLESKYGKNPYARTRADKGE